MNNQSPAFPCWHFCTVEHFLRTDTPMKRRSFSCSNSCIAMSFLECVYWVRLALSIFKRSSVLSKASAIAQTASYVCPAYFECVTPLLANSDVNLLLVCVKTKKPTENSLARVGTIHIKHIICLINGYFLFIVTMGNSS